MDREALAAAVELAETLEQVFVATADRNGQPHVGVARRMELGERDRVAVTEWFCPGTLANAGEGARVSLVVWDAEADAGFQLTGKVEAVETVAMMDGYDKSAKKTAPMPQTERKLVVRVEKVTDFTRAPHTDVEE
jgi:hypothetical protein